MRQTDTDRATQHRESAAAEESETNNPAGDRTNHLFGAKKETAYFCFPFARGDAALRIKGGGGWIMNKLMELDKLAAVAEKKKRIIIAMLKRMQ